MIDLKTLETFLWVARQHSFRATAERLNTTQPAVSQRIAALERTLGVSLLHRTTRRVSLTAKGRILLDYAERLITLRSEMIAAVGDPAARDGTLRLGITETIVHTWLPRLIERTEQVFPRLSLEIEVDTSPNLAARLAAREIDLAVMLGPVTEPGLGSRELCRYPVGFVASPRLGLPTRRLGIADIGRHTIVTFARKTRPHVDIAALFARAGTRPARIHASASLATIVRMALDGLGIAAIPPVIVATELAEGRLHLIKTTAKLPSLQFCAAWRDTGDPALLATVVDLAAAIAADTALVTRAAIGGRRTAGPRTPAETAPSRPSRGTSTR